MIKVGVIGCGYWGPNLIRNLNSLPEAELVAIADLDPQRLEHVGLLYPGAIKTVDHRVVVEHEEIDAIIVATPMGTHKALGTEVLEAGKHLFLEKPMATSSDDCRALMELAAAKNLQLMVGHTFLYSPAVRKIKSLIDEGELGDIYYANISRVNLGIFQQDANVVWDLAPHDISMLTYLFGSDPVRVTATGHCYVQRKLGIEDVAFINLEFPDGRMANIHVSWLDPNKIRKCTFVGSKKMLVYDDVSPAEKIRLYDKGADVPPHYDTFGDFQVLYRSGDIFVPHLDMAEPLKTEMGHFLDVIAGRDELLTPGRDGLRVVQVLEQACRSIAEGGRPLDLVYDD
ncbi:MAG: Gfo/Idh/MocA family oxidoreductase [bacterium]|nr:Gfo/Idh/MocA family oxidoreductase [bacterium]